MNNNLEYFTIYSEVASQLLSHPKKDNPAIKSITRFVVREATNTSSSLPGYDNKLGAAFMSKKAYSQMQNKDFNNLIGEHIVPISVILRLLEKQNNPSPEDIRKTVTKYSHRAIITKQEDNKLRDAGLSNKMPDNWDNNTFDARYKSVKIDLLNSQYKELKKIT